MAERIEVVADEAQEGQKETAYRSRLLEVVDLQEGYVEQGQRVTVDSS